MKKRDYSSPRMWQQSDEDKQSVRTARKRKKPLIITGCIAIILVAFFSFHHSTTPKHLTVAKKTGPEIKAVTLPIHAQNTITAVKKHT